MLVMKLISHLLILARKILQHRRPADSMLISNSSRSPGQEKPASPKYSERLSPAINHYLSEAARHEVRVRFI